MESHRDQASNVVVFALEPPFSPLLLCFKTIKLVEPARATTATSKVSCSNLWFPLGNYHPRSTFCFDHFQAGLKKTEKTTLEGKARLYCPVFPDLPPTDSQAPSHDQVLLPCKPTCGSCLLALLSSGKPGAAKDLFLRPPEHTERVSVLKLAL